MDEVKLKVGGVYANADRTLFFYAEYSIRDDPETNYHYIGLSLETNDSTLYNPSQLQIGRDEYMEDGRFYSWSSASSYLDLKEDITGTELAEKVLAIMALERR